MNIISEANKKMMEYLDRQILADYPGYLSRMKEAVKADPWNTAELIPSDVVPVLLSEGSVPNLPCSIETLKRINAS